MLLHVWPRHPRIPSTNVAAVASAGCVFGSTLEAAQWAGKTQAQNHCATFLIRPLSRYTGLRNLEI